MVFVTLSVCASLSVMYILKSQAPYVLPNMKRQGYCDLYFHGYIFRSKWIQENFSYIRRSWCIGKFDSQLPVASFTNEVDPEFHAQRPSYVEMFSLDDVIMWLEVGC